MDSLLDLHAFTCIAEAHSLSGAALVMGVTPSAVSKRLTRLERRLGVQLVHRTTRQFRLTEDGRVFFERCKEILGRLRDAEREVVRGREQVHGTVRVAASHELVCLVLVPALSRLLTAWPELEVELRASDAPINPLTQRIDVALFHGQPQEVSLRQRLVGTSPFVTVASPAYLSASGTPRSPRDLDAHVALLPSEPVAPFEWYFGEAFRELPPPRRRLFATSGAALVQMSLEGLGLARVPRRFVTRWLDDGRLVTVLEPYTTGALSLYARYPPADATSPRVRAVLDWMAEAVEPRAERPALT
jgi:DNA-binding transcriptional LysR family regulator